MNLFTREEISEEHILAIDDKGDSITGRQLNEVTKSLLETVGGRKMIFLLCRNIPGILLIYIACLQNGIVPLLLDARIDIDLLKGLTKLYRPSYLICPEDVKEKISAAVSDDIAAAVKRNNEEKAENTAAAGIIMGCSVIPAYPYNTPKLHENLALLLSTSGSTGSPKLVRLSRKNILSNTRSIIQYLHITETERPITNLALNYSYGMSVINTHIMTDAVILLTEYTIMEKEFWERVRSDGATSLTGVPYTYQIFHRLKVTEMELPSLRYMTQAGGKLSKELHMEYASWAARTGKRFYVMYGQTEASPRMGYLPAEWALEKCGAMGIPVPGGSFKLIDANGDEISEPDIMGELVYSGDNTAMGYALCSDDLIKGDEWHGILQTGDMAVCDRTGFYYIVGRKKRFVKMFGNRVGLDEAEDIICSRFSEEEFACVGCDDRIKIITTCSTIDRVRAAAEYLASVLRVPEYAVEAVSVVQIPKNANGKRDYGKMEKLS